MRTNLRHSPILNYIFGLVFLTFTVSCKQNSTTFDDKLIQKISNENPQLPSKYANIVFFGRCTGDKFALVYLQDLKAVYKFKYKDVPFAEFLKKSLNQQISIDYENKIDCFDLDKEVTRAYEKNDFKEFLSLYSEQTSCDRVTIKKTVTEGQINTVLYYLFINNYVASFDDYIGKYFIKETASI